MTISWSRAWGESWGLSWGLTYEANQDELLANGGGPDASDSPSRGGRSEEEKELEHQESFERFKKVAYPLPSVVPVAVVAPVTEKQVEVFSKPASPDAALSILTPKPPAAIAIAPIDPSIQRNKDEEALLLILLEA